MNHIETMGGTLYGGVQARLLCGARYVGLKRSFDVTLSLLLLLLAGLLMLLVALIIRFTSPGPALFRQARVGKDGKQFYMLKFRSMRTDSDTRVHREYVQSLIRDNTSPEDLGVKSLKLTADPRITRAGKVIRALSIDELPQLLNVLRGDMSIIGPRPPLPYEYEMYSERHKRRLAVIPGITGLWQVTARNQVSFEDMVSLDIEYIENMSPLLDLRILVQTPLEVLRGIGAG